MRDGWLQTWARTLTGLALGAAMVPVELGVLLLAGLALLPVLALPSGRAAVLPRVHAAGRRIAELDRRRVVRFLGAPVSATYPAGRAPRYLAVRWLVGTLGGLVLLLLVLGLATAGSMWTAWIAGGSWSFVEDGGKVTTLTLALAAIPGAVLLYLDAMGIAGVADLDRRTAVRYLGPSRQEALERRVSELAISRAEVVQAVNDERRRIERDLHDGVQQRLVALGILLGRARRGAGPDLLEQAQTQTELALDDLRDVAWRVYPTLLDQLGLRDVLADLAERSSIPVTLSCTLPSRPPATVETAAYFVVSEAMSNAAKHSGAGSISITVASDNEQLTVEVRDDGFGGADPAGRGLLGLAGRVRAVDGVFTVDSPDGGPTVIRAELPCG